MKQADCIWTKTFEEGIDLYRIFRKEFLYTSSAAPAVLEAAADSTFTVWINGRRCPMSNLMDMPQTPVISALDVTEFLVPGANTIAVEVHYIGANFLTYRKGTPFLRCELTAGDDVPVKTDSSWKCAESPEYLSGLCCQVSSQLGYVYQFDARQSTAWKETGFDDSAWQNVQVYQGELPWKEMNLRKVPYLLELPRTDMKIIQRGYLCRTQERSTFAETCSGDYMMPVRFGEWQETALISGALPEDGAANGYYIILDTGRESVGYFTMQFETSEGTVVDIAHGEHLDDGRVRARVGYRNFTDRYICRDGMNEYIHTHRRLGCRYIALHITGTAGFKLHYAGLIPVELPLPPQAAFHTEDQFLVRLNSVSADTLKLCMHEHYEDCPWREQALYAYDSRNQILYGYYVWGNYSFAGACIDLLGKSYDGKRYLSLTSPGLTGRTIPVFTMVWITEMYEHFLYSGNTALFAKWQSTVDAILDRALADTAPGGLYQPGTDPGAWNFCEWNGMLSEVPGIQQAPYNIYLHEALNSAAKMHEAAGNAVRAEYLRNTAKALGSAIENAFWDPEKKCYNVVADGGNDAVYEHIQVLMLANGLVPEDKQEFLLKHISGSEIRHADLSALCYVTNGLLKSNAAGRTHLMGYLRSLFEPIIYSGATSLWETKTGADDFSYAGSLCHGWSSVMPYLCGKCHLGVMPLEPGFRKFSVKIHPGTLTHAEGEVPTPAGMIRISWKLEETGLRIRVSSPVSLEAVPEAYEEYPVLSFETETY